MTLSGPRAKSCLGVARACGLLGASFADFGPFTYTKPGTPMDLQNTEAGARGRSHSSRTKK